MQLSHVQIFMIVLAIAVPAIIFLVSAFTNSAIEVPVIGSLYAWLLFFLGTSRTIRRWMLVTSAVVGTGFSVAIQLKDGDSLGSVILTTTTNVLCFVLTCHFGLRFARERWIREQKAQAELIQKEEEQRSRHSPQAVIQVTVVMPEVKKKRKALRAAETWDQIHLRDKQSK